MTQDHLRQLVNIHQPPPVLPLQMRVPNAFRLDLNVDAGVLCGRYIDEIWRLDLVSRQIQRHGLPDDGYSLSSREIVATRTGHCATPASATTLLVLDGAGEVRSVRLGLPEGQIDFDWQDLAYDDVQEMLLLIGRTSYAVIPAEPLPESLRVRVVSGQLQSGSIENTHFSNFRCCARLDARGDVLYTVALLVDENMSAFTGLAAIDVASGQYRRMYLPFAPAWQQTGRPISPFDRPWFELAGSTNYSLWPRGRQLVLEGFADFSGANDQRAILRVDVDSGNIEANPRRPHASLLGVSKSGRLLLWRDEQDQTVVTDTATQAEVNRHPGIVVAVAHARNPEAMIAMGAIDGEVLTYRSSRPADLGIDRGQLSKIASWLRTSRSLEGLRQMLQFVEMSLPDPETGRKARIGLDEVVVHAQGLSLPRPEIRMPRLAAAVSPEDGRAWADYAGACDRFAADQGEEAPLALLQCLVAPW